MNAIKIFITGIFCIFCFASFAQETAKEQSKKKVQQTDSTKLYCCSMHKDAACGKPGKCSKCGMKMEQCKKGQMKTEGMKQYSCPMHSDAKSNKKGKCPKCGMDMTCNKE